MTQDLLAKWLKTVIVMSALCLLIVYAAVLPMVAKSIVFAYPEFSGRYHPWSIFCSLTAIPCAATLIFAWKIAANIGRDRSFSMENAKHLRKIAYLAAIDAGYFFIGNIVLLILGMNHPTVFLVSMFLVFIGIGLSVAAAALSHLVQKVARQKNQGKEDGSYEERP